MITDRTPVNAERAPLALPPRSRTGPAESPAKLHYEYGLLAAITVVAAVLRFYALGDWGFWIDEIFTLGRIRAHFSSLEAIFRTIPPAGTWLPLSLLFSAGALNLLGVNEWSARLVPAVLGVVSIPALYFPLRRFFNRRVGMVAVLLLAISPWHLAWSQNARFYTALMLFYSLALLAFYHGLERNRPASMVLGLGFFYLALSERLTAGFLVLVVGVYLVLIWLLRLERPPGFQPRVLLLLLVPVLVGGLVEVSAFARLAPSVIFGDLGWFLAHQKYTPLKLAALIGYNLGFPLMCLAAIGGYLLVIRRSRIGLLLVISVVLPPSVLLLLSLFLFSEDRYVFMTLPGWVTLAAVAVDEVWRQARQLRFLLALSLVLVLAADSAGDMMLYYSVNNGHRYDWRGALTVVRERAEPEDLVVAYWPQFAPYYLDREIIALEDFKPEALVESGRRAWFVLDSYTVWGLPRTKRWVEQNAELIDVIYLRRPEDNSLHIYLYDPARAAGRQ